MSDDGRTIPALDPGGFNELRMCRDGPMLYNRFDAYIGQSLRKYGEFSFGEQELFRQLVRPGAVVVEVGANIGAHTVGLARLVGHGGAVIAFEPQRIPFQTLCANLALNQLANVRARQAAVGRTSGTILVPALDPSLPANFGGVSLIDATGGEEVPLLTVDSMELPACHLLKVDVEGMEADVLVGAERTIRRCRPLLYVENDREDRSEALLGIILGLGYAAYWHLPRLFNPDNFAGDAENIFGNTISANLLCIPGELPQDIQGMRRVASARDSWRV